MNQKRFSEEDLYELRNKLPVKQVIRDILNIPSKTVEGIFRFLCPKCNEFQTAVKEETNLGRCFRCEKNFNPIDIVIACKGCSFVESVKFLKQLRSNTDQVKQLVAKVVSQMPDGDRAESSKK